MFLFLRKNLSRKHRFGEITIQGNAIRKNYGSPFVHLNMKHCRTFAEAIALGCNLDKKLSLLITQNRLTLH